jgi:hypothetical protein
MYMYHVYIYIHSIYIHIYILRRPTRVHHLKPLDEPGGTAAEGSGASATRAPRLTNG